MKIGKICPLQQFCSCLFLYIFFRILFISCCITPCNFIHILCLSIQPLFFSSLNRYINLYFFFSKVHSFLIANLAVSDLLMGMYLLTIAVVDIYYRGVYSVYDSAWRSSKLCAFAGFLSTFSSELSVFTLTGQYLSNSGWLFIPQGHYFCIDLNNFFRLLQWAKICQFKIIIVH